MTGSFESALAALAGSAIGGFTTLAVTWLAQRTQLRTSLRARDQTTRQKVYKQFIEEASKLYGEALVNNELEILRDTGCYADFTMPSAPHPTQTWKINSIYSASDRPGRGW